MGGECCSVNGRWVEEMRFARPYIHSPFADPLVHMFLLPPRTLMAVCSGGLISECNAT